MNQTRNIIYFFIMCLAVAACTKDDIPDPYQPVDLSKINRLDFISGNDSSIYVFDANMILTSGRDNNASGIAGYEWFTMEYADQDNKHLSGAIYRTASSPDGHMTERQMTYSLDERNMLSKVTREDWASKSFSFVYDDKYRLSQLTMNDNNTINRYSITYDDQSNVTSVEVYRKVSNVEGTSKTEFSGYDGKQNPFRFLINAFYAPFFSSNNGAIFYGKVPLGMLLSKNNPGKAIEYIKDGDTYSESGTEINYSYEYGNNNYPASVTGGGLSLNIKYHQ